MHTQHTTGTVTIYNSRLVHRGSANTAADVNQIRPNFMFSLMERGCGAGSRTKPKPRWGDAEGTEGNGNGNGKSDSNSNGNSNSSRAPVKLKPPSGQTYALLPEYGGIAEGFKLGIAEFVDC